MKSIQRFLAEIKFIGITFLVWRIGLFLVGILAFRLLTFQASFAYIDNILIASKFPQWIWQWGNFDGVHYLEIAEFGYRGPGLQTFFPLYPVAIKTLAILTNNRLLSGLLISNLASFFTGLVLYFLVKRDYSRSAARWAVLFFFFFPTSFFLGSVYTESLFLLFLLLAFYGRGVISGAFSILAGVTRLIGAFVLPAGFLGVGAYMTYLYLTFGNALYFLTGQEAFKNARADSITNLISPFQVVFRYLKIFLTANPAQPAFQVATLEFTAFTFGVAFLLYLTINKKVKWQYLLYAWPALLLPSFSGTFSSMPRYLLVIFPIYLGLALIKNPVIKALILSVFVVLLMILTTYFVRGYWIS